MLSEEAQRRAWLETLEPKMVEILDNAVQGGQRIAEADLDAAIEAARASRAPIPDNWKPESVKHHA